MNGNFSREEFRAVSIMSFLHLAVLYDSPAVVDLKATASSPEMRLQKIAERVKMSCHVKSKAILRPGRAIFNIDAIHRERSVQRARRRGTLVQADAGQRGVAQRRGSHGSVFIGDRP